MLSQTKTSVHLSLQRNSYLKMYKMFLIPQVKSL